MVYPTMSVLTISAIVMAVLLAADWYVWGLTYANSWRESVRPRGVNKAVAGVSPVAAEDERQGFKKVA
jgi:hypothetical protein